MPIFKIPVTWEMCGEYYIEAPDRDKAINIAINEPIKLPSPSEYVSASLDADENLIEEITDKNQIDYGNFYIQDNNGKVQRGNADDPEKQ